jgi:conjugal transfer mating pair stabilization protein TraG
MTGGAKIPEVTRMTVAEIGKKYGNKAIGKYQIQRDTAFDTLRRAGLDPTKYVFNEAGQDRLFDMLLEQRGKVKEYRAGKIGKEQVARNLASVWAGLPVDASGRSRYEGESGNKAHISWNDFLRALD